MRFLGFIERGRMTLLPSDAFKKEQNVTLVTNFAAPHHIDLYLFNKTDIEKKWSFFDRSVSRPGYRPETFLRAPQVRRATIWGHGMIPGFNPVSTRVPGPLVSSTAFVKCIAHQAVESAGDSDPPQARSWSVSYLVHL